MINLIALSTVVIAALAVAEPQACDKTLKQLSEIEQAHIKAVESNNKEEAVHLDLKGRVLFYTSSNKCQHIMATLLQAEKGK